MDKYSNKIKYWSEEEENKLIDEINELKNINDIIKNHDRKMTGITMRIEKIIENPEKSKKITNINNVVLKYLSNKYWSEEEENILINEINELKNINDIIKDHDRKMTGIIMRIEKIIENPEKSKKIININNVVLKYLSNKNEYSINYDELYSNILKYNSLEEISDVYNKISKEI